jgi:hypothetical protein
MEEAGPLVAGGAELRLTLREELRLTGVGRVDGVAGEAVHGVVDAVDAVAVGGVLGRDVVTGQTGLGAFGAAEALDERLVAARLHVGLAVAVAARAGRVSGEVAGRPPVRVRAEGLRLLVAVTAARRVRCEGRSTNPRHPEDQENEAGEAEESFHHLSPLSAPRAKRAEREARPGRRSGRPQ